METQARSTAFYHDFFYYEVKGGIGYQLGKSFTVLAGTGSYNTYQVGGNFERPAAQLEWRIWQELTMKQDLQRLLFEHRYRTEQRITSNGYRNRLRYRMSIMLPLNKQELSTGAFYLYAWDEIFGTYKAPYFERNRVAAGAGYKAKPFTIQMGWLNQFDYSLTQQVRRNFLQISLLFDLSPNNSSTKSILLPAD